MLAELFGFDGVIVLVVVALVLFGGTQLPKLARSLGSARKEFERGVAGGGGTETAPVSPVDAARTV